MRDAKQYEHQCKTLQIMNNSLQKENARLKQILDNRIVNEADKEHLEAEKVIEVNALVAQVSDLTEQLAKKKQAEMQGQSRLQ